MEVLFKLRAGLVLFCLVISSNAIGQTPTFVTPSTNTNIVGITPDPARVRDLGLKQQQEPSCIVRPGNESYIFCAYNDLRAADLPTVQGDSWMGVSMSNDAGQTWFSRLAPGFLGHPNSLNMGFAADPGVVAIPGNSPGLAILNYIAAFRDSDAGVLAIQRWVEYPQEDQDFWKAEDEIYIAADGSEGRFIDKPAFLYIINELSQQGTITEQISVEDEAAPVTVTTPTGTLVVVYAVFTGNGGGAKLLMRKSFDNGKTWTQSEKISEEQNEVTGVSLTAIGQDFVVVYRRRGDNNDSDAIMSAFCSLDGNKKCTKGQVIYEVCPFDQPASGSTHRTFTFPWAANDGNRFFAFSAHRSYPDDSCPPVPNAPGLFGGKPRVVGMSSINGKTWVGAAADKTVPFEIAPRDDGMQVMPVAFGTKGRVDIAWYDTFREEDVGLPAGANDLLINDYIANDGVSRVFRKADVWMTRLTAPSCSNNANAGCTPVFESPVRVSQYNVVGDLSNPTVSAEIEAHLPNLPLYKSGTLAFNGDYISLATPAFRRNDDGKWKPNSLPGGSDELSGFTSRQDLFVAWGDNRDVRADLPPLNSGQQLPYTPPLNSPATPGGPMADADDFDDDYERPGTLVAEDEPDDDPVLPSDIGVCTVGSFDFSKSRDSNVYSSLVRDESSLVAPTPTKPLGTIQRMFPVIVTNIDEFNAKDFCLEIANQPLDYPSSPGAEGNGLASFYQLPAFAPFMQGQEVDVLDVEVPAGSSASRAVFITTNNGASVVTVNAYEDACPVAPGDTFGPLINSVQLADGNLFDPVFCEENPGDPACDLVALNETHDITFAAPVFQTAVLSAPVFQTPGFQTPVLQTPSFQTPAFQTPSFQTPGFQTPVFQTPVFQTPVFQTPSFQTPVFQTPSFQTPSFQTDTLIGDTAESNPEQLVYQDIHYPVNAQANVLTTYSASIAAQNLDPDETAVQLIAWTPNTYATSADCLAQPIANQQIIAYTDLDAADLQSVNLPTTFSVNDQNPYAGEISWFAQPGKDVALTVRIWAVGMAAADLQNKQAAWQACKDAGGGDECDSVGVRADITFGASAHGCRTDDAVVNTQNPDGTDCLNNGNEKIFEDKLPPVFSLPPDITIEVEADLPEGAEVDLTGPGIVTATDQGENVPVVCWEVAPDGSETELPDIFDIGTYSIRCEAVDDAGNVGSLPLIVDVTDTIPPVLTLNGDINPTVEAGTGPYIDPGYTASDTRGTTIIPLVATVTGSVDTNVLGVQILTYVVTDTGGNTVEALRNVTVQDTIAPTLSGLPGDMPSVEATGPGGATVSWVAPTANDSFEGSLPVSCVPASGTLFGFGTTIVNCTASDSSGNLVAGSFSVTVSDTVPPTPPVLPGAPSPDSITAEATGASGAVVSWTVLSSDAVDPSPSVACVPASGSTFPIGTTPVVCTSTDAAGNSSAGGFDVIVQDTTAPDFGPLADLTAEATSPDGAPVTFGPFSATDIVDGSVVAVCVPASGALMSFGVTPVACTATDSAGNVANAGFSITVSDTTAPVVTASNIDIDALSGDINVEVDYVTGNVVATDAGDANPALACGITNPDENIASDDGMTAIITGYGSWVVSCSATDSSGNVSSPANFNITVAFPWNIEIDRLKGRINAGSTVPLDWRYLDPATGNVVDSAMIVPNVQWTGPFSDSSCTTGNTNMGDGEDSGSSDFRYNFPTWQFNWQTPSVPGYYLMTISPPGAGFPDASECVRTR